MLKRLVFPVNRREVDGCSIADLVKPDIVGACMRIENVSKHAGSGPLFYSLKDSKGGVLREGKTERKLSTRIREYKKEPWFPMVSQVCVQPFNDTQNLSKYEKARVNCDCPPFNTRLKTGCP